MNEKIQIQINNLPLSPGCYIFKNKHNEIIYIGKSKCIKKRVKQYFTSKKEGKLERLAKEIADIEYITTVDETDALFLECKLIKKHKSRYNSQLKRDRIFPFIKIDTFSEYPSIVITNEIISGNDEYFGCFYSENDAIRIVEILNAIWKTPTCNKIFNSKSKVCLSYHIGKCCAPCEKKITKEEYRQKIDDIKMLFKEKNKHTEKILKKEMLTFSNNMEFEKATIARENIFLLKNLKKKISRLNTVIDDRDCFIFFRAFNENIFSIFFIKNGIPIYWEKFLDIEKISLDQLNTMISKIKNEEYQKYDETLMTHIFEIYADKLYVPIEKKYSEKNLCTLLEKKFKEFMKN